VLNQFWQRYHVDFDRIVADGSQEALAVAALFPNIFAGLVLRDAEVDPALAGAPLVEAERTRFSHSHADAGPALGTYWRFPQSLVRAMQNYLQPARADEHAELAGIVGLAAIAAARGEDLAPEDLAPLKETLEQLAISAADAARLMREAAIAA